MSLSLSSDRLLEMQEVCSFSVIGVTCYSQWCFLLFWTRPPFFAIRHVQLSQLSCVIQSDVLNVYHFPDHLFFISTLPSSIASALEKSQLQHGSVPFQFPLPDVVIATDATPIYRIINFQVCFSIVQWILDWSCLQGSYCILPCKNFRLLHWCSIKLPFGYLVGCCPTFGYWYCKSWFIKSRRHSIYFSFQTSLPHFNLPNMPGVNPLPAYLPTHINLETIHR